MRDNYYDADEQNAEGFELYDPNRSDSQEAFEDSFVSLEDVTAVACSVCGASCCSDGSVTDCGDPDCPMDNTTVYDIDSARPLDFS